MKQTDVSTPSPRMAALAEKRKLVNALMGGTFAMRKAAETWLPKHPAESDGVYKTRLQKTFLDNFLELAIAKASGKVFKKLIKVESLSPQIEELLPDIDRQKSSLDAFAQEVGKRSLEAGVTYVLVDMPPVPEGVKTAAAEKAAGVRPYAAHIDPDSIIEILTETAGGAEIVKRVRIMETVSESDGEWGYVDRERVRVLEMRGGEDGKQVMCFDVYQKETSAAGKVEWVLKDEFSGITTFPAIFLTPFYSNRTAFMEGQPGFQNIAESTLEHWQWKSEHAHALSMCCFGMYTATGVDSEFDFVVGPGKALKSSAPDTKFGVLETTGTGVTLSAAALAAIESRIETAGVNLRVENAGQVTATAASLDSAETNAGLMAVAQDWSGSWLEVIRNMATIQKVELSPDAKVEVNTDFGSAKGTQQGLPELGKARLNGDLSRKRYWSVMKWRGEVPEDFDEETNDEELDQEAPPLGTLTNKKNTPSEE